jgi:hypothetical protein
MKQLIILTLTLICVVGYSQDTIPTGFQFFGYKEPKVILLKADTFKAETVYDTISKKYLIVDTTFSNGVVRFVDGFIVYEIERNVYGGYLSFQAIRERKIIGYLNREKNRIPKRFQVIQIL